LRKYYLQLNFDEMKKGISKMKLTDLGKVELVAKQMDVLKGGYSSSSGGCSCGSCNSGTKTDSCRYYYTCSCRYKK
jgi:natural product precursor